MTSRSLPLIMLVMVFAGCGDKNQDSAPKTDTDTEVDIDLAHMTFEGIELVRIPSGSFTMGAPSDEVGNLGGTETQHEVALTRDYWIGVTELTQGQFQNVMGYNPSANSACGADCPVETVSWYESAAFGNALSDAAGLERCYDCTGAEAEVVCTVLGDPYECEGYRLPTEAEWERAARAGTTTAFSSGGNIPEFQEEDCSGQLRLSNGTILDDYAVYCGNEVGSSEPVASRLPNSWGLFDVHGNLDEWCHDQYQANLGASAATDPFGSGSGTDRRVMKSSAWYNPPSYQRSAARSSVEPGNAGLWGGLRVSRAAAE